MTTHSVWRWPLILALLTAAILLHSGLGPSIGGWLGLLLLAALAIGALARRREALALALLSWPLGIGLGVAPGRFIVLGDAWPMAATLSVLVGFADIALGALLTRGSITRA